VDGEQGIVLDFTLNGLNFDSAGEASSKLKRVLQQIGISSEIIRRIAICSYEAEMNVIIHAFRGIMKVTIFSDRTEIILEDEGPGIKDIDMAMQEGYSTAPDYVREMGFGAGMGLPNIARCADEFNIKSEIGKGTKIFMMIRY
jgi:anti-sigma regulatory factor (Ser/Thr protein kinase)